MCICIAINLEVLIQSCASKCAYPMHIVGKVFAMLARGAVCTLMGVLSESHHSCSLLFFFLFLHSGCGYIVCSVCVWGGGVRNIWFPFSVDMPLSIRMWNRSSVAQNTCCSTSAFMNESIQSHSNVFPLQLPNKKLHLSKTFEAYAHLHHPEAPKSLAILPMFLHRKIQSCPQLTSLPRLQKYLWECKKSNRNWILLWYVWHLISSLI